MCARMYITLTWFIWSYCALVFCESCNELNIDSFVVKDVVYVDHVMSRFKTRDVVECARSCIKRRLCESINFDSRSRTCELNDRKYQPGEAMVFAYERIYSDISVWPDWLEPGCYSRPCRDDEVCMAGHLTGNSNECSFSCFKLGEVTSSTTPSPTTASTTTASPTTTSSTTASPTTTSSTTASPTTTSSTTGLSATSSTTGRAGCVPVGIHTTVNGMTEWCNTNCPENCPADHCICE